MAKEKVLVIDDEEGIREALEDFLEGEGYAVTLADSGKKALDVFSKDDFSLVITDIKMPGMDGIETMRQMKKAKPGTKVIIVSGLPDEEAFERAMTVSEGTVEGFVPKPFKPADLREALAKVKEGGVVRSFGLTEGQLTALAEIGKTGAENASQALFKMAKREIKIAVQEVSVYPLSGPAAPKTQRTPQACAGILLRCSDGITGTMAIVLSWESGLGLVDILQGADPGTTKTFDEKSQAVLQAAGNVIATSYLSAVGKHLGLKASVKVSGISFENEGDILKKAGEDLAAQTEHVVALETCLEVPGAGITVKIVLLPDTDSLRNIFRAAGGFKS